MGWVGVNKPALVATPTVSGSMELADLGPIVRGQTFGLPMKELAAITGVASVFGFTGYANPLNIESPV